MGWADTFVSNCICNVLWDTLYNTRQVQAAACILGATTLRIRPRVRTFRRQLPAGHAWSFCTGRARDFMKTIVSAPTARNDDVNLVYAVCSRQTRKVLSFTMLPTARRAVQPGLK